MFVVQDLEIRGRKDSLLFLAYKSLTEGVFECFCAGPVHDPFSNQGSVFIKLI